MGVTFHTLTSTAIAAIAVPRLHHPHHGTRHKERWLCLLFLWMLCILSHGVLDMLPHQYPLPAPADVGLTLFGFVGVLSIAKPPTRWILVMCFLGCLLPDIIDLTLPLLNRKLGLALPTYHLFPWHWPAYFGSIFDGRRTFESHLYHGLVLLLCSIVVFTQRRVLFNNFSCIRSLLLKHWRQS